MITAEQAYDKFLIKVNDNFETSKIAVDKGRFALIYNEAQNKYIEYLLEKKNEDDIRYLQKILVSDLPIPSSDTSEYYELFPLPKDYFDFSNVWAKARRGKCIDQTIHLYEIKSDNANEVLKDEFNRPDFRSREAPFYIQADHLKVYKEEFTYQNTYLTYFRYPTQIRLIDPEDPESSFHPDYNPEFDDKLVDRVLSLAASEFEINSESAKFQLDKQRAQQKI